jgi:hypothetical protein
MKTPPKRSGRSPKTAAVKDPDWILRNKGDLIDAALRKGVREALLLYKERGKPVVIERNGEIVWVPADELLRD